LRLVALRVSSVIERVAEGDDIAETDPGLGETVATPSKVAALTQISNEPGKLMSKWSGQP
jgi:hypothetical protein